MICTGNLLDSCHLPRMYVKVIIEVRFDLAIIMLTFEPALLLEQDYYELYSEKVI